VVIRLATSEDVPAVRAMELAWAAEGITAGLEATNEDLISSYVGGCFFVAEAAGRLVGFVRGRVMSDDRNAAVVPRGESYAELEDLYVLPEFRAHGAGTQLVEAACEWARLQGVSFVTAFSSTTDVARILRFYESAGFRPWAVQFVRHLAGPAPRAL
jgi:GNAT superfamily N-acetyltransferase